MRIIRSVIVVLLFVGCAASHAKSEPVGEAPLQARAQASRNGDAIWALTVQGVRVQFIRAARTGRVTLLAEDRQARVTAVDITDAASTATQGKEVADEWEVVPIYVNPSTGGGTYGLYMNGAFFGLMIVQPNGTISVVINPK